MLWQLPDVPNLHTPGHCVQSKPDTVWLDTAVVVVLDVSIVSPCRQATNLSAHAIAVALTYVAQTPIEMCLHAPEVSNLHPAHIRFEVTVVVALVEAVDVKLEISVAVWLLLCVVVAVAVWVVDTVVDG